MKLEYEPMVKLETESWISGGVFTSIEKADHQLKEMIEYYERYGSVLEKKIAIN